MAPPNLYRENAYTFVVQEVKEENASTRYTVSFPFEGENYTAYIEMQSFPKYEVDDMLIATTTLASPTLLFNDEKTKSFHYETYLHEKGIVGIFAFPKIQKVGKVEQGFHSFFTTQRRNAESSLHALMSAPESDLTSAMIFGSNSLTKEETMLFRKAGISHIVALSGFNISIIIAFLSVLLFFLPFWIRIFLSVFFVSCFLLMTEMSGSLLRAVCMALIVLIALVRGSTTDARKVLMLSLLFLSLFFPKSVLTDASFHLSFLAMAGVLFVYPAFFQKYVAKYTSLRKMILELFFMTLSVTILVTPYTAFVFNTVSLYGIVATLMITFLVPFITIAGICEIFIHAVSPFFAKIIAYPLYLSVHFIVTVAQSISSLPLSTFVVSMSETSLLMYYAFIVTLVIIFEKGNIQFVLRSNETKKEIKDHGKETIIEGEMYF